MVPFLRRLLPAAHLSGWRARVASLLLIAAAAAGARAQSVGWIAVGESPIPTPSLTPTESPTASASPTESLTPTQSPSPTESETPSPSPTESLTPSPSPTESLTPSPSPTPNPDEPPPAAREFRASWVATVANIDFPSAKGISSDSAKAEIIDFLDKTVATRMNAVLFQVRTQCDALYDSSLEPWSEWLTGTMGTAPAPAWDPLAFTIEEGHKRGIEVHAWFNPYRALQSTAARPAHASHISQTRPDLVRTYDVNLWLDPGEPEVPQITLGVMMDVVERYDVDGIHIDDYFYPYPVSGLAFPDATSFQKYKDAGGTITDIGDWRRDNVNRLVHDIYTETKARKPWVKVGISPFGIWRPGYPAGITGLDSYNAIYGDSKLWLNEGWIDYYTPQLYWKIASAGQDYTKLLPWWVSENTHGRHIWPGNYLAGVASSWAVSEIVNQITFTRTTGATGNVFFSIKYIDNNTKSVRTTLANGVYAEPALVPASPWLGVAPPAAPSVSIAEGATTTTATLNWTRAAGDPNEARRWVIYRKVGANWTFDVVEGTVASRDFTNLAPGGTTSVVAISGLDKNWNEGPRTIVKFE